MNELITQNTNHTSETYEIVSTVGYLIGLDKETFENPNNFFRMDIYESLDENVNARIIRNLSVLRTDLERNFGTINEMMRYDFKNIHNLPTYISDESLSQLSEDGINIVKANHTAQQYIIDINKHICDRINNCKELFPVWLNWEYIKKIFIMPNGLTIAGIEREAKIYYSNINRYPYHKYINWSGEEQGNILYNDKKFVTLLYRMNGDYFADSGKVTDASNATKENIYQFLENHERTIFVVDCENSDPYKLYAMLKNIDENALLEKVQKIILCDDAHTTRAWSDLEKFIGIPVEHELVERIKEGKSLVDHKLITKTCKEIYKNQVDSILLFSSDSDYWGMISEVSEANFMVMIESGKCGPDIKNALVGADIPYVYIDDFCTGNCYDMTVAIVLSEIRHRLNETFHVNMQAMLNDVCKELRTNMDYDEKLVFYNRYIKPMHLFISESGDATLKLGI